MANLKIDLYEVNCRLVDLRRQLNRLERVQSKLLTGFGEGWKSSNADKVNEELNAFQESVGKIKESIASIEEAVDTYKKNVSEIDKNTVSLESK